MMQRPEGPGLPDRRGCPYAGGKAGGVAFGEQENRLWKSIFVKRLAACPVWTEGAAMLIRRRRRADGILAGKG